MVCLIPRPIYPNPPFGGVAFAASQGDGYTIELRWFQAYSGPEWEVAYNIYYSTIREDVFSEGVKYVIISETQTKAFLTTFKPGDVYYFAVRATLHDPNLVNLSALPSGGVGAVIYPEGMLLATISETAMSIPVSDIDLFPPYGIVQIGFELIVYSNIDIPTSSLIVSERGYFNTNIRMHTPDGYDGYETASNPFVRFFSGWEDLNISVVLEENKFDEPNFARTDADGYRQPNHTGILTTNLASSEASQINFRSFDFAGWLRTDPVRLLAGECVGSYYGGEYYCADGYFGVGQRIRGLSIEEINDQRQEVLLSTDGEPCVLVKRMWSGITCSCVNSSRETPEHRCSRCLGTGFVIGYEQFYNFPRRSDGRIMVRFDPSVEDLVPQDAGLESKYDPNAWTLSVPIIRDRDFLIRFNFDGTEEFRYEVLNVERNKILLNNVGAQKMALARIRKTDPIYMFRSFRNTATMPQIITTGIGMVPGPGGIPPHIHTLVVNEHVVSLSQINQTTGVAQGHDHPIINGVVQESVGHGHLIIFP